MSKRRQQVTEETNVAVSLYFDYNKMKNSQQRNIPDQPTKQFNSQFYQTLQNDTVRKMVEKLHNDKTKIPLEILGLNQYYSFNNYNAVQSQCLLQLMFEDNNILVCAPTATGKTVIMEMAIFRELGQRTSQSFKMLYLAPIRALCQQKVEEWSARFSSLNVTVSELTGDSDFSVNNKQIKGAHLIVATPEKWDWYIRKQKNTSEALSGYNLLLLDEVHCVGDLERGAILECVVSRLKSFTMLYKIKQNLRIVAVSATLPNIEDIAVWLKIKKDHGLLMFKESDRSVPLEKHVLAYNCENQYSFENYLNFRLLPVIERFSENKPTLVFCQTQKGTQLACASLIQQGKSNQFIKDEKHAERLMKTAQSVMDKTLANFIKQGIAFHNANLIPQDRIIVEKLFLATDLIIICTTTTLALGVNLPAHLVIIKSTLCYKGPKLNYQEYSLYELCQMMGRAGRPQFDDKGIVVIMTEQKKHQYYHQIYEEGNLKIEQPPLESYLGDSIPTLINAEIGIGYISTLDSVMHFIRNTYYYVRQMVQSQKMFENAQDFQIHVDKTILDQCSQAIDKLNNLSMINYDAHAKTMESTDFGKEVARQSLEVQTIDNLFLHNQNKAKTASSTYSIQDILGIIVQAQEFMEFKSKQNERTELSKLNKIVKWKLKGSINTPQKKIYVFLQAYIYNLPLEWELRKQSQDIIRMSTRILKCFLKFFQTKKISSGFLSCLKFQSYIEHKAWPDDPKQVFSQLSGVGEKTSADMIKQGFKSLEQLSALTSEVLSEALKKNLNFSETILNQICFQPSIQSITVESISCNQFELLVIMKPFFIQQLEYSQSPNSFVIVISEGDKLLYQKKTNMQNQLPLKYKHTNDLNDVFFQFKLCLINTVFVGTNEFYNIKVKSFNGRTEILESKKSKIEEVYQGASNIDFEVEHVKKEMTKDHLKFSTLDEVKTNEKQKLPEQYLINKEQQKQDNPHKQEAEKSVSIFGSDFDFSFTEDQQDGQKEKEECSDFEGESEFYNQKEICGQAMKTNQDFNVGPMLQNRKENQKIQTVSSQFMINLHKREPKQVTQQYIQPQKTVFQNKENLNNQIFHPQEIQKSQNPQIQKFQAYNPQLKPQEVLKSSNWNNKKKDIIFESNKKIDQFLNSSLGATYDSNVNQTSTFVTNNFSLKFNEHNNQNKDRIHKDEQLQNNSIKMAGDLNQSDLLSEHASGNMYSYNPTMGMKRQEDEIYKKWQPPQAQITQYPNQVQPAYMQCIPQTGDRNPYFNNFYTESDVNGGHFQTFDPPLDFNNYQQWLNQQQWQNHQQQYQYQYQQQYQQQQQQLQQQQQQKQQQKQYQQQYLQQIQQKPQYQHQYQNYQQYPQNQFNHQQNNKQIAPHQINNSYLPSILSAQNNNPQIFEVQPREIQKEKSIFNDSYAQDQDKTDQIFQTHPSKQQTNRFYGRNTTDHIKDRI